MAAGGIRHFDADAALPIEAASHHRVHLHKVFSGNTVVQSTLERAVVVPIDDFEHRNYLM